MIPKRLLNLTFYTILKFLDKKENHQKIQKTKDGFLLLSVKEQMVLHYYY